MSQGVLGALQKISEGHLHDLTRSELHGLTNERFVTAHKLPADLVTSARDYIATAARTRNSTHPNVKRLDVHKVMEGYSRELTELYIRMVNRAIDAFDKTVLDDAAGDMVVAQEFSVSETSREVYLQQLAAIMSQTKNDFKNLAKKYSKQAYKKGKSAALKKLKKLKAQMLREKDAAEIDSFSEDFAQDNEFYYDQMTVDVQDKVDNTLRTDEPNRQSMVGALVSSLFSQQYRNDLFVSDVYRVAQTGQADTFDDSRDPGGAEWKYKWHAVIDLATCVTCIQLDRLPPQYLDMYEWAPGDVHPWCRCDLEPVPPEEEDEPLPEPGPADPQSPDTTPPSQPIEGTARREFDQLRRSKSPLTRKPPRNVKNKQALLANVSRDELEDYMAGTDLRDKLGDAQRGNLIGERWPSMTELVEDHFIGRHGATPVGNYADNRWWSKMSKTPKALNREIGHLVRVDSVLDGYNSSITDPEVLQQIRGLKINRVKVPPVKSTASYNGGTNMITFSDQTFTDLRTGTFSVNEQLASEVVAHEVGHSIGQKMSSGLRKMEWAKMKAEWTLLSEEAAKTKQWSGFATPYSAKAFKGEINLPGYTPGDVDEDIADSLAKSLLNPNFMQKNPIRKKKFDLLRKTIIPKATTQAESSAIISKILG